ncbi:MAG: N-acetyltransferase [Deltaproteobacteria bacterium]|nr:N-acetyltransferase [Deltaproteobacteria bacterium]
MRVRNATTGDASAIAAIYNQGIEERIATFETALRADDDVLAWFDGVHPIVVVLDDDDSVVAFARASEYSPRECYRGIFDYSVYTDFAHRRRGAGMMAMRELVSQARAAGAWKLVSRVFVDNEPSRMLMASLGFREVGVHHRHARLEGKWRDVVVVEKFLAPIGVEPSAPPPPPTPRSPREATRKRRAAVSSEPAASDAGGVRTPRASTEKPKRASRAKPRKTH